MTMMTQAALKPGRVVYVTAPDDAALLSCLEEGLRHGGVGAVIAEPPRLPMTASRRLQLAAEASGSRALDLALRRWRRFADDADFGQPTAALTRWRVSSLPSAPLPVPGFGRARWLVELMRCRGGGAGDFVVEACDGTGRLRLPADPGHGSRATDAWRERAAG